MMGVTTSGFRTYPHLYKTELCRRFAESGGCKYGDRCQFAHGLHELRLLPRHPKYKTEYCRTFHTLGFCPYQTRCHFIHEEGERRIPPPQLDTPARRPHCGQLGGGISAWHPVPQARARSPASDGVSSSASETPERCPGSPSPPATTATSSCCHNNNNNFITNCGITELLVPLALKLRALEGSEPISPTGSSLSSERQSPTAPDCSLDPRGPGEEVGGHQSDPPLSAEAGKRLPVFSRISTRST
ncbi:mRNA decay activator protein ZFP36L2-like isoform X2 [Heterodontus francisci]